MLTATSRFTKVFVGVSARQAALQFAQIAAEGGQQWVADVAVAGVVAAEDGSVIACELLPQVVAGVGQPEVKVMVGGQGTQELDLGGRQPGVAEQ